MKWLKKGVKYIGIAIAVFMLFNAISIYQYSLKYSEKKSDVAIVLGAGTSDGIRSPVFTERINHGIYLYKKARINKIIFTGGKGENQTLSDSQIAKEYAIEQGVPSNDIFIEEHSIYTYENLAEAKLIMDSLHFSSALIVSDPIHMQRSMELAISAKIDCESSPTQTSMYKSTFPKLKFLAYETFFYTLGKLTFQH
ncbi:MAG: YdcF family protein [Crocinitomix sp.]|nr:YdcF family protein [Crocinitomix sp.]